MSMLVKEVQELLLKGAILEVSPSAQLTGFYTKYFIVPKTDGCDQPVLGLRPLNRYLKVLPFKIVYTRVVMQSIRQGEWFTSLGLKDIYFLVQICPEHRPFLGFQGRVFQFQVLPIGLTLAPRVFTTLGVGRAVPLSGSRSRSSRDLKVLLYLDDWLIYTRPKSR